MTTCLDGVEEFENDGGDASEERGSDLALHLMAVALDLDKGTLLLSYVLHDAGGIYFVHGWEEHGVWRADGIRLCVRVASRVDRDALGAEEVDVAREGARVRSEVFVRGELGGIDEDGDHGEVVLCEGPPHLLRIRFFWKGVGPTLLTEGEVAVVEGTHGGHETDGLASVAGSLSPFAHGGDGVEERELTRHR